MAIIRDGAELGQALDQYEQVYAASWKPAEPYPGFIRRLAAGLATAGALRLGFLHLDGRPIAAQLWIVWHGTGRSSTSSPTTGAVMPSPRARC